MGEQFVSGFIESEVEQHGRVPLDLLLCNPKTGGCGLLQLRHTVSQELMYRQYWYLSGMNQSMRTALADITGRAEETVRLQPGDLVLDIGCNDGTLLRSYRTPGLILAGFEPSVNVSPFARDGATKVINDFFNVAVFQAAFPKQNAKIITSIAMFYDLDDPNQFVSGIAKCLDRDGLWVIQMSYLPSMLDQNAFDNICHEHLEYYSLMSLQPLLERHGLEVADVELNDVNGGSFRIYVRHQGSPVLRAREGSRLRVQEMEESEKTLKLNEAATYRQFDDRVRSLKQELRRFLETETQQGKRIYAYGASTKGNTLLQYFELHADLIPKVVDKNPDKWGKKTVGSGIPIISEEQGRAEKPDYLLILPWHFLEEFKDRERAYLKGGGKFIVPIPELRIIGADAL